MADPSSADFLPTASLDCLARRAELLRRLRRLFDERGFIEVETPLLSADTVVDTHLDPLGVTLFDDPRRPGTGHAMWLQTSPEFGMKRLLAAGATAIYQVTRAFRGGERGRLHNPEFTIVEWYRVGDRYDDAMRFLGELTHELLGLELPERLTYADAFLRWLQIDPHTASTTELASAAGRHCPAAASSHRGANRDEWLNLLLAEVIEPKLGLGRPTILHDYPASQAALARIRPADQSPGGSGVANRETPPVTAETSGPTEANRRAPVAERFELYVNGIELANGYHELLDPAALRARSREHNERRQADGRFSLPEENRLLHAMEAGLPPSCGVALGFDRLVMIAVGAKSLAEVIAFPIDRA